VDDRRPEQRQAAVALLAVLERDAPFPGAPRVGVTGAPGAGKSTLLDALVRALRPGGDSLAIVAVDPSSRSSGGALLGDRIRVRSAAADAGVFLRSMAARDRLGGLADATWPAVAILAAAFDRVFVETVGVGQSELDVAALVDSLVYVVTPGSGDVLQFMKAGVIEAPDVFLVNKADVGPEARRTASDLKSALALSEPADAGWTPPVLLASARDGSGVDALVEALGAHRQHQASGGGLAERRARGRIEYVLSALTRRYGSFGLERIGGAAALRARLRAGAEPGFAAAAALGAEIEEALRKS
jgi:LAO/AO transport system kinase